MSKLESSRTERRTATRYRVPGNARLFWPGGEAGQVSLADMSSSGCSIIGSSLPGAGTKVFLSLDIGGLPNVRLPATTVRCTAWRSHQVAAVRFDLPRESRGGLDKLLAQHTDTDHAAVRVLLIDSQERTRARIEAAVRATGAQVISTGSATEAVQQAIHLPVGVVLARGDDEGLTALDTLSRASPGSFRVVFGRGNGTGTAMRLGLAQASADDPCSAKCLSDLLRQRRGRG